MNFTGFFGIYFILYFLLRLDMNYSDEFAHLFPKSEVIKISFHKVLLVFIGIVIVCIKYKIEKKMSLKLKRGFHFPIDLIGIIILSELKS